MKPKALLTLLLSIMAGACIGCGNKGSISSSDIDSDTDNDSDTGGIECVWDGGFEGGSPNKFWDEASTYFGTPLCDEKACGVGSGTGPRTGLWWVWLGGIAKPETGSISQTVEIGDPPATLTFFLEIAVSSGIITDVLQVKLDDDVVFEIDASKTKLFTTYTPVEVDLAGFAPGIYNLSFTGSCSSGFVTNFFVDDVSIVSAN